MLRFSWLPAMAALAMPLQAQDPAGPTGDSIQVIVDRVFTDTLQSSRVTLFKKTIYQLELSRSTARPRLVPVRSGVYPPTALRIRDAGGPIGGPVYEVHVDRDGEYDVGISGTPAGVSVQLRLHTDASATLQREVRQETPRWSIGLRAEFGQHTGYLTGADPDSPDGGSSYDGCVLVGKGTNVSLCLGGGVDSRGGGKTKVSWILAELQVKLVSLNAAGRFPTHVGVLGRVANGNTGSDTARDPSFYGLGVYLQQMIAKSPGGRGLSLLASAQTGVVRNVTVRDQSSTAVKLGVQWLP